MYAGRMASFTASERRQAGLFSRLAFGNPFEPARREVEVRLLGRAAAVAGDVWSRSASEVGVTANLAELAARAERLLSALRPRAADAGPADQSLYADLAAYVLYYRHHDALLRLATAGDDAPVPAGVWRAFAGDHADLLGVLARPEFRAAHLWAMCFQTRRAFVQVFDRFVGGSPAAARLRADVWHSVFTHDRRRHAAHLVDRMRDLPTLILGESGTGKELVATAVARAQFRGFDDRRLTFEDAGAGGAVLPINLAAVPEQLVESTLFGHKRGSFTGASADRRGLFEEVGERACVFLDEVGEVPQATQVKLLRVLQERTFQRVGDHRDRRFAGKVIAATHRDLAADIAAGAFRADLFYRLSGDIIRTPPLREQVAGDSAELARLVRFVAGRVAGEAAADSLAGEVLDCVGRDLGEGYGWPGNFRELEQCVRNVLVRRCYRPDAGGGGSRGDDWLADAAAGRLTADALLDRYVAHVHARRGSHVATAAALGLDRRTVKARLGKSAGASRSGTQ